MRPSTSPATMRRSHRCAMLAVSAEDAAQPARGDHGSGGQQGAGGQGAARQAHRSGGAASWSTGISTVADMARQPEIRAFLDANPAWPDREPADPARRGGTVQQRRQLRARSRPSSPAASPGRRVGLAALASAHLADKDEARAKALAPKAWIEYDIPAGLEPAFLKRVGAPADRGRPQAPPRPAAAQRQPLDRRAQRARRRHPPRHRAAVGAREEEGGGASGRVPARQELAEAPVQAAGAHPGRLGPGRAEGPGSAPPEEGGGGLEDPAGGAGVERCRQAGRLVGGAARQRLRGAQARQAQDGLRPGAQSRGALRQCRQGCLVPRGLAGAAPPARTPSWRSATSRRWPRPPTGR